MAAPVVQTLRNFINGEYCAPLSGAYVDSYCPARGRVEWHVPNSNKDDVEAAVRAAQAAFPRWAATPVAQRAAMLNRIADIIERVPRRCPPSVLLTRRRSAWRSLRRPSRATRARRWRRRARWTFRGR